MHLLILYPPKLAISALVFQIKVASSKIIRSWQYPTVTKALWGNALWRPAYFASSCGGAPISIIKQYIEQQNTPN